MNSNAIFEVLAKAEPASWLLAFAALYFSKMLREYRALGILLLVKFLNGLAYNLLIMRASPIPLGHLQPYVLFFNISWVCYMIGTVATFFLLELIIRRTLAPLSGLSSLSSALFRGTGAMAIGIAITAHLPDLFSSSFDPWLVSLLVSFALCMCIFEVSLLFMLLWTIRKLGLSLRSRIFGLSIGLAIMGAMDFAGTFSTAAHFRTTGLNIAVEVIIISTQLIWTAYILFPEPKRRPLQLAASSTLLRWNEVVSKLGIGPQPIAAPGATFMTEVVDVVDRIMMRNAVARK